MVHQNTLTQREEPASTPTPIPANSTTEAKLRELKRLHDEGLISDDVYAQRQKAILDQQ
jgi:hypothetical protein